ncbi:MAG: hypothetical protein A4E19_13560 [Nitrospira sp. SG-bin1]|nr:MAG: hypothetical protein A4E19_13560 [Nitrospira sp. SG-bin1]
MLTLESLVRHVSQKSITSMAYRALLILPIISLTGCTGEGAGGPVISSLSAPTDTTVGLESDQGGNAETAHSVGEDGEEDPVIAMISTNAGITAHVTWDPPSDIRVAGYSIHYGKRTSGEASSEELDLEESGSEVSSEGSNACTRGESQAVDVPSITITGLEPNTRYFFAIRAFNDSESICSNEITAMTPSTQSS